MYRLYIDETGNADLGASADPNHRYLSLTGLIFHLEYVRHTVTPQLEQLKHDIFGSDPDDPLVLHRKDILNKSYPAFVALRDGRTEAAFNARFLSLLSELDYTAFTVVIDKLEHLNRYKVWRHNPYHYCLECLIERYVLWLNRNGATGDVMGEVRGGKFDRLLEASFARLHERGNDNVSSQLMQRHLTSKNLKLRAKTANISGLQLADAIAHPSALNVRGENAGDVSPSGFGAEVVAILEARKYDRSTRGRITGYGKKWLP